MASIQVKQTAVQNKTEAGARIAKSQKLWIR